MQILIRFGAEISTFCLSITISSPFWYNHNTPALRPPLHEPCFFHFLKKKFIWTDPWGFLPYFYLINRRIPANYKGFRADNRAFSLFSPGNPAGEALPPDRRAGGRGRFRGHIPLRPVYNRVGEALPPYSLCWGGTASAAILLSAPFT